MHVSHYVMFSFGIQKMKFRGHGPAREHSRIISGIKELKEKKVSIVSQGAILSLSFTHTCKHRPKEVKEDMMLNTGMWFHNTVQCQNIQN